MKTKPGRFPWVPSHCSKLSLLTVLTREGWITSQPIWSWIRQGRAAGFIEAGWGVDCIWSHGTEMQQKVSIKHDHYFWWLWQIIILWINTVNSEWVKIVCHYVNPMMHRKQVSTPSYESDTNDRPFSVWVLTILTSEACHHSGPHTPSPAFILTPIQITEWPWVSSPLSLSPDVSSHRLLIILSPHALISQLGTGWTILPCQPSALYSWL